MLVIRGFRMQWQYGHVDIIHAYRWQQDKPAGLMGSFKKLQPVVICITCVHSPLALSSNVTRLNTKMSHLLCVFILSSPHSEHN